MSVWVRCRKSLSIRKYDHIGLGKKINKIREENNKMNIQKNRVLMLQETCNEGVANGHELSVEDEEEILSLL